MAQNKRNSDDIVKILDCVDENLSEVESGDSDNEIDDNQESDHKSSTSDSDRQVAPVVSGWCDVKCQMKVWVLMHSSGRMAIPNFIEILHSCALVQI
jgi:hypothetical protein